MRFVILPVLSLLLLGTSIAANSLEGKWRLDEYRFADNTEHASKGVDATLVFRPDNKLGGDTGCNSYGGSYTLDTNGALTVTEIISTMRACEEPTSKFEKEYFDLLRKADLAEMRDGKLIIADEDGHFLSFVRLDR